VKTYRLVFGAMLGVSLCAAQASAQSTSPSSTAGWQGQFVPYLWASGLDGQVGIDNRTAEVDASFGNVLSHLHFAAMGMADARLNKFVVVADAFYTDLRGEDATPGPLFSSVEPRQKVFFLTPEAGYRVVDRSGASLDVLGGIRLWHLSSELQFQSGLLPGVNLERSRGWVDAIVGARVRKDFSHKWAADVYGDVGGGGSDPTYQIVATANLNLHERYGLTLGYRYLKVDYDKDNFLMDTAMKGPIVGFAIKF
jgi:hypothetical protein